ncbi:MAG: class I SAM-dependent methyltransferase [Gammaproteobacteria bacterium]|nr:MAG: class I SAM-dependent methyltransferase [Gammaproteobacteria bacterium]
MRRLIRQRLRDEAGGRPDLRARRQAAFFDSLREGPIALATDTANAQHYEVPAVFFETVLGRRLKYSCAYYDAPDVSLDTAEARMLALTCERAGVEDGMQLMDLGCGWGSLALWLAEHYPSSRITALSNSHGQREHIEGRARAAGYDHLEVVTANVAEYDSDARFDRVLSVEMFEHMHNYDALLRRVAGWLHSDGRLFTHVFCHRDVGYHYQQGDGWMEQHFFTGGIMPREDQFAQFPDVVTLEQRWWLEGTHYQRTCNDWLAKLDAQRTRVADQLVGTYGPESVSIWLQRWRMFFMACAELFGLDDGSQYGVVHSLMSPRR